MRYAVAYCRMSRPPVELFEELKGTGVDHMSRNPGAASLRPFSRGLETPKRCLGWLGYKPPHTCVYMIYVYVYVYIFMYIYTSIYIYVCVLFI